MSESRPYLRAQENFFTANYTAEEELVHELFSRPGLRVERIASAGQDSGPFCQEEDEWVLLLEGRARLIMAEADRTWTEELSAGDWIYIPARLRHWVENLSPRGLWLCVFCSQN